LADQADPLCGGGSAGGQGDQQDRDELSDKQVAKENVRDGRRELAELADHGGERNTGLTSEGDHGGLRT
jgi:hypothetical protein